MKGVKITVPKISEMSFDPEPYPGNSVLGQKFHTHLKLLEPSVIEAETKIAQANELIAEQREHLERLRGTMETMKYFKDNWT